MIRFFLIAGCLFFFSFINESKGQIRYDGDPSAFLLPDEAPEIPRLLASGLISTGLDETGGVFTPDYHQFYFTINHRNETFAIVYIRFESSVWRYPEVVTFSGLYNDTDPFITACGTRLYFSSTRPVEEGGRSDVWNIWYVEKDGNDWGEAIPVVFNLDRHERHPSKTNTGELYFHADYGSSLVTYDLMATNIYVSSFDGSGFGQPSKVASHLLSDFADFSPVVSPDGRYMIFASNRPGGNGGFDLYITFRNDDGTWGPAHNMGEVINGSDNEHFPSISPDGRFLFFSSNRRVPHVRTSRQMNYSYFKRTGLGPGNGLNDIYMIGAYLFDPDATKEKPDDE
ncbi:TolB family protein [Natronoflexus pectinivorans]|uniref:WD40 repeat protein n=1 Tax=Natronoflexus pectinivorans TaxID=682526 RepID=A0A4R2GP53_9BACT|nr:PD40 domain-containing protein [Natronoflexus pectinivorans]TCO10489.1 WD40 repeat protein [Natronoflexus pectinivorans]